MKGLSFRQSCCTTPSAAGFWAAMFALFYGMALLLGTIWPGVQRYGDTVILTALGAACFANFSRNRTLHCGLTGPLFLVAAILAFLMEAGIWSIDHSTLWGVVLAGVAVAFLIEWRTARRSKQTSHA
jgi:asparagine N-glycosylation enzyme membrane subunit Stt3